MSFTYTLNVPNPPNTPAQDVPNMQTNTNSIASWVSQDHFGFGTGADGRHLQVSLPNESAPAIPALTNGVLYANNPATGASWPLWENANGSYQIIGGNTNADAAFATFSKNTNYQTLSAPKPSVTGGWTYLAGGMLLQYGIATDANLSVNNVITFPVAFSTFVGSVVVTGVRSNTNDKVVNILNASITNTQFILELSSSDRPNSVTWIAIGV